MKRPKIPALFAAVLSVAALAGCQGGSASAAKMPPALTPAQTTTEYRAEATTLTLAPGWSWPAAPIADKANDGNGIVYEPGFGRQAADFYWYCSWVDRTLDTKLASTARQQALANVLAIKTKYYYTSALDPDSRPYVDNELRNAQLGDYALLENDFQLNCPQTRQ